MFTVSGGISGAQESSISDYQAFLSPSHSTAGGFVESISISAGPLGLVAGVCDPAGVGARAGGAAELAQGFQGIV